VWLQRDSSMDQEMHKDMEDGNSCALLLTQMCRLKHEFKL